MKRIYICIIITVISILMVSSAIVAAVSDDNQPSKKESQELAVNKRIIPQEDIDEKYDESKLIHVEPSGRDDSLDKKLKELEEQDRQKDIADKEAYAIVNRYSGDSYSTKSLITNKEDDCAFMNKIIDIIKQGKIDETESNTLKAYLSRRLEWLDSGTDKDLIREIRNILQ